MSNSLPNGWVEVPIGSFARVVGGGTPPSKDPANFAPVGQGIPWVTPADLSGYRLQTIERGARDLSSIGLAACGATLMPKGTVLFSSRAPIGYVTIAANEISTNQGFKSFVLPDGFDPRFTYYQLKHLKPEAEAIATGTTFKELSGSAAATLPIRVAPLPEQTRIADQLDKLLARIQSCNDRLDAIPALLKRFRQALITAATSGSLTEDWRAQRESRLTRMEPSAESGNCVRDSGQLSYQVTPATDCASLHPSYAANWSEVQLSDVIVEMRNGLSAKPNEIPPGTRILRISAVRAGRLDLADHRYLEISEKDANQYSLKENDLLFTRYNGSLEFVGVCALVKGNANGYVYPDKLIRVRVNESKANAQFIETVFGSEHVRQQIENYVKSSAGQKGVSGADLKATKFMLPPLAEQTEIVRRVEALFQVAARIEARYTAARTQAQRLTPRLLAKAFRGELVQHDPQDEPASVLLESIAAATPTKASTSRGWPRIKPERQLPAIELKPADWASLSDGAWAAPADPDGLATMAGVVAVLRAWGKPVLEREARLAALFCLQPRLFTAVLPVAEAKQWSRLIGDEARPLPAQVLYFQPAINSHWGRAIKGMRARGDLVEAGTGSDITWTLGAGTASIETAGWPDGRAGFVVAYLCAHGTDSVLPLLETSAQEFANARAA